MKEIIISTRFLLLLGALALLACECLEVEEAKAWRKIKQDQDRRSRENCLAHGRIIIESAWNEKINDCVEPSTKARKP